MLFRSISKILTFGQWSMQRLKSTVNMIRVGSRFSSYGHRSSCRDTDMVLWRGFDMPRAYVALVDVSI